jgi:preprotein translocase subunit SecE
MASCQAIVNNYFQERNTHISKITYPNPRRYSIWLLLFIIIMICYIYIYRQLRKVSQPTCTHMHTHAYTGTKYLMQKTILVVSHSGDVTNVTKPTFFWISLYNQVLPHCYVSLKSRYSRNSLLSQHFHFRFNSLTRPSNTK